MKKNNDIWLWILIGVGIIATATTGVLLSVPRGIRNKNPGNLRLTTIPWQGKVPNSQNTDGEFEQFTEMKWGVRALIKDLISDIQSGVNTLRSLITEYAPGHENDTDAYVQYMIDQTGFTEWQTIKTDKSYLYKLTKAIAKFETGQDVITENLFNEAYNLI